MSPPLIELVAASRTYNDGHETVGLRAAMLAVHPGDYITLTGASGSGKSTLLNLLGLLDTPDAGSVRIRGVDTEVMSESDRSSVRGQLLGFVFQAFHLLPARTAIENVEIGLLYGPFRRGERRRMAAEALAAVGLADRATSDTRVLSGGERQRVAIARAIAARPALILCDEPTGNLDLANTRSVLDVLGELNRTGLAIVIVTHDAMVAATGRRRLTITDGKAVEEDAWVEAH